MKQNKRHAALYQFLSPLLETGVDDETLAKARKEYTKAYKAKWQREHRKTHKRYTISFNKADYIIIKNGATNHHKSQAHFIKTACLAYCNKRFIPLDEEAVNGIRELMTMNYCLLQQISEDKEIQADTLLSIVASLERKVLEALTNPKKRNDY